MSLHPIILCGGPGSRLWPASTAPHPKPFIDLLGGRTLFQRTAARLAALTGARRLVVVTGPEHIDQARDQLNAIGCDGVILAEPAGRDSGPALLAAVQWLADTGRTGLAIAVASDHHIPDEGAFAAAVALARHAAEERQIVTFGVEPDHAATAYGYVRPGKALDAASGVFKVAAFVEKPDAARAQVLIDEGCLWNSGNFMFRLDVLLEEAARHAPRMAEAARRAVAEAVAEPGVVRLGSSFLTAPRASIDIAVMEKTDRAAVIPIDYAWSDLGSWDAVWASAPRDEHGNVVSGVAVVPDSVNCLVRAGPGTKIVAMGVSDLAIVAQGHNVLVSSLTHSANLKGALSALETASARRGHFRGPADQAAALTAAPRLKAWFENKALPLWWCFGADHTAGGFHERLRPDRTPVDLPRRARVQARQVHVYALAGLMGWAGPWQAAVAHGLDYLAERFPRADGLCRATIDAAGLPVDDTAHLYDQAFVLLALATAARALPDRHAELSARAESLMAAVRPVFALPQGGFRATEGADDLLADPVMHLFEAALAWVETDPAPVWLDLAREIAELFLERMYNAEGGYIVEAFAGDWSPASVDDGRIIEPGHQFEWAWLMERWSRLRGDPRAQRAARALYASGERGVDPETGLVWDGLWVDFTPQARTSRLWPQTERVKAALLLAGAARSHQGALHAAVRSASEALEAYLDTPMAGLWRDTPQASVAAADEPALASSFYHIAGAVAALDQALAAVGGASAASPGEERPDAGRSQAAAS